MAKKHLSEDEIKYIVSAETSKAQEEIHSLTKETKKLKQEEKERKTAMLELEAQGQKASRRYQNLAKESKVYSDKIKENNKRINELTKGLDVNSMSTTQLKKLSKELTSQLDNMSEAADPEAYAKLNKQLQGVRSRMADLRNSGRNVSQEFDLTQSALSKLKAVAVAFITVKLAGFLQQAGSKAYETRKEFAKYEATLRNTLQSQEKAAQSMKMLQQLAADTPASLREWTEGYIKLVNRGLKPTTSELTNLGDVASSQGKDIDQFIEAILDAMTGENERLKEFGIRASKNGDTVKYTFRGVTTEVKNSEEAIKNYLISLGQLDGVSGSMAVQMKELEGLESNFSDTMDNMWNKLGKRLEPFFKKGLSWASGFVSDISKAIEPLSDTFDTQLEKVVSLETTLPGMTKRYDELAGKLNRNATEQKELNTLVGQLSTLVPSAISEWDQYGNVISINTGKVNEFLAVEKARLNYIHREEIQSLQSKKEQAKEEMKLLIAQNKRKKVWAGGTGYGNTKDQGMRQMSEKELAKNADRIKELSVELTGINAQLDTLRGEGIDKIVKGRIKSQEEATTAQQRFNSMNKAMLAAWLKDEKNAADKHREIAEEIFNKRFPATIIDPEKAKKAAAKALAEAEKKKKAILDTEKSMVSEINQSREDDLQNQQKAYNDSIYKLNLSLAKKEITQESYDIALLAYERSVAENRLSIEQEYYNHAQSLELLNGDLKVELVRASNQRVLDAEKAANMARTKELMKLNNLIKDFKEQFKVTTVEEDLNAQKEVLSAGYEARKKAIENEIEEKHVSEEDGRKALLTLKMAYDRATEQLEMDHQQRIQSIKERYGLSTEKERLNAELALLKDALDKGFLNHEQYAKAVEALKRESYKKQFDYYSNLFSGAVNALQQAEIDNVEAKYDAEIAAAQGNSEEVERLENEKAQAKLDVEKKYADIQFAVKASQIVADTAMGVMTTIGQLGLPWGLIPAALVAATGAAQLMSANAERQKVKNMTLSGGKSSSSGATRVATGRESGGSIDVRRAQDGKLFKNAEYDPDARGFIDRPTVIVGEGPSGRSKEWVASNAAVENPTIAPILNLLDRAQQAGTIRTLDLNQAIRANMSGFASGGRISPPSTATPVVSSQSGVYNGIPSPLMEKFAQAIISIDENGIPASVSLTDIDRANQLRDRSRSIGSKS